MKFTAPSSSPCAERRKRNAAVSACLAALLLGACATPRKAAPPPQAAPLPSFNCDTTAQEILCSNEMLAKLDKDLQAAYHRALRRSDSIGRGHLVAMQSRWLTGRAHACAVPTLRIGADVTPPPALTACLIGAYADRIAVLRQWPAAPAATSSVPHPLAAYVEFRQAEYADAATCTALAGAFNGALRAHGALDIARLPGMSEIAGTHDGRSGAPGTPGEARAAGYRVDLQDAGPYAGHALRTHTLAGGDGRVLIDEAALGHWVRRLPNHGGRASSIASQTGDYESIDVFRSALVPNRTLALVAEPWGRYAPGAQGEWSFAGVYQLGTGGAEPLCLYRTYMTPPLKNELARLSAYSALQTLLEEIRGPRAELVGRDLHDDYQLRLEQQWMTQNMPLIAAGEAQRNGWSGWLRRRHDAVLDALFAWSERSLRNKIAYRRLLPLLPAAAAELADTCQRTQRLSDDDARQAASVVLMRLLADSASDLAGHPVNMPNAPLAVTYAPKYPILASEADVQRDRSYGGLYSAALNGADKEAIDDYIKYEFTDKKTRLTRGAEGETALMAAVESPGIVRQLLTAGASANETDARGRTPLMNAAAVGQPESARLLLEAGATGGRKACELIKADAPANDKAQLVALLCK